MLKLFIETSSQVNTTSSRRFSDECEPGCRENRNSRENLSIGKSQESPIFTVLKPSFHMIVDDRYNC